MRRLLSAAILAIALAAGDSSVAHAQLFPTTTSTTLPETTTSTPTTLADPTTTVTTEPPETTTTVAPSTTTVTTEAPQTTTTATPATTTPTTTTPAFVPPSGVTPTTSGAAEADEVLEADTGRLPLFVALSLGGFAVALAIVTVQWVRTRPTLR